MTMYEMKAAFVAEELTALLRKCDKGIDRAKYTHDGDGAEEYVTVHYTNGSFLSVCVTANSLAAITRDVLAKAI